MQAEADSPVDRPHTPGRPVSALPAAERDGVEHPRSASEPLIRLVERDRLSEEALECDRVSRLHEERAGPGQSDDLLAVNDPQERIVVEISDVGRVHPHSGGCDGATAPMVVTT